MEKSNKVMWGPLDGLKNKTLVETFQGPDFTLLDKVSKFELNVTKQDAELFEKD